MRFATSEQARQAGTKLGFLRGSLGREVFRRWRSINGSRTPRLLFGAKSWSDARNEYATILPELSGADRERAQLRILECGVALGAAPAEMAALQITDPDVDAERLDSLAEYYRAQQQEAQMVAAVEGVVSRAPSSHWAESALFPGGKLLLGAARPRSRRGLLQAARGKFPDCHRTRRLRSGAWRGPRC